MTGRHTKAKIFSIPFVSLTVESICVRRFHRKNLCFVLCCRNQAEESVSRLQQSLSQCEIRKKAQMICEQSTGWANGLVLRVRERSSAMQDRVAKRKILVRSKSSVIEEGERSFQTNTSFFEWFMVSPDLWWERWSVVKEYGRSEKWSLTETVAILPRRHNLVVRRFTVASTAISITLCLRSRLRTSRHEFWKCTDLTTMPLP